MNFQKVHFHMYFLTVIHKKQSFISLRNSLANNLSKYQALEITTFIQLLQNKFLHFIVIVSSTLKQCLQFAFQSIC